MSTQVQQYIYSLFIRAGYSLTMAQAALLPATPKEDPALDGDLADLRATEAAVRNGGA